MKNFGLTAAIVGGTGSQLGLSEFANHFSLAGPEMDYLSNWICASNMLDFHLIHWVTF